MLTCILEKCTHIDIRALKYTCRNVLMKVKLAWILGKVYVPLLSRTPQVQHYCLWGIQIGMFFLKWLDLFRMKSAKTEGEDSCDLRTFSRW